MDVRFLSSVIEVVEVGSIAEAARNQNLTSAAISQRIKSLENTLGCELLNRSGHSANPTDKCLRILPRLKRIIAEVEGINGDIDDSGLSGELRVGSISTVLSGVLPKIIKELSLIAPNLKVNIVPGTSAELYRSLTDKKIDVALTVDPPFSIPKYLKQEALYSEELGLICKEKQNRKVSQIISSTPYVQYDRLSWGGRLVENYLFDNKIEVTPVCELDSLESIALMVKQGMGISLIPIWKGMEELIDDIEVIFINNERYRRHISLLSHRQLGKESLVKAFSDVVLKNVSNNN